jgi:hypothetical protein
MSRDEKEEEFQTQTPRTRSVRLLLPPVPVHRESVAVEGPDPDESPWVLYDGVDVTAGKSVLNLEASEFNRLAGCDDGKNRTIKRRIKNVFDEGMRTGETALFRS